MSLHKLATEIQKKGRGDDTMLMHVTPGEVKGLQAIAKAHGGSLTINPDTGLVEAGFLKNIMPMVIGAGLTAATGGAAAPWMIGLGYGGFEAARTGDISKGLMAGLGAYGGAGLAGGLMSAGTSAAGTAATDATVAANPQLTGGEIAREMGTAGFNNPNIAANANPATMSGVDKLGAGFNQVTASPQALGQFAGQNVGNIAAASAPVAAGALEPKPIDTNQEEYERKYPELSLAENFRGYAPQRPNPYYTPRGLGYTGYAEGGQVDPLQQMPNGGLAALQGMRDGYGPATTPDGGVPQFAAGGMPKKATRTNAAKVAAMDPLEAGLAELNNARAMAQMRGNVTLPKRSVEDMGVINAAKGRYLKGDGDGMSDDIPATINGKQPARLADGEFVVPADVVSHLGNGSSDAGAKRLYAMMDKVRVARTGKKKQAPAVKTDKYLPA